MEGERGKVENYESADGSPEKPMDKMNQEDTYAGEEQNQVEIGQKLQGAHQGRNLSQWKCMMWFA